MSRTKNCGKCDKPKSLCKCGRPHVVTKEVLQKLEAAFMYCFTDEEACLYAGIAPRTLYVYQENNPEFKQRKVQLKLNPNLVAKKELVKNIEGNLNQARWWAQTKISDEFGLKTTVKMDGKLQTEDVSPNHSPEAVKEVVNRFETELKQTIAKVHGKTI